MVITLHSQSREHSFKSSLSLGSFVYSMLLQFTQLSMRCRKEVEEALRALKGGKSPGANNIPAELLKHGGPEMIKVLATLCQRIWKTKEWPKEWTQSMIIPLPKNGNLRLCKSYGTISLISHPSKIMLLVILNRLKGKKAEEILAEEQAGFRAGRSITESIDESIIEKHLLHKKDLIHNFIDFDCIWHEGLWEVMRNYNFNKDLIQVIQALYTYSNSAVLLNNQLGDLFSSSLGCPL